MAAYSYGFVPMIHVAALVLVIIELGLIAYVVSVFTQSWYASSPSSVNFMLFNSIWSLLVLAYVGLAPLYFTSIFHRLASLALEAVTMIFWFAGAIALAVAVGGPVSCGDNHICGALKAAVAFGWFIWVLFCVLVVLDTIEALRSRRHHTTTTADGHQHKPQAYPGA
jgi:hypothetical protein